jgi:hypothetical protein
MKPTKPHIIVLLLVLLIPFQLFSQKWVADTLVVNFGTSERIKNCTFSISDVTDKRAIFPQFISVFQQKKWLFFPVDQIVTTKDSLSVEISNKFQSERVYSPLYHVDISEFKIKNAKAGGKRALSLFATLELSKGETASDSSLIGTFYYENSFLQKKKEPVQQGYDTLIERWSNQFSNDIFLVTNAPNDLISGQLYYFRKGKKAIKKNFYTSAELFGGLHFWGVDAELWFSEPEGNRIFNRGSGVIRYVNHPTFQSIAIGSNVRRWNYRINEKWLFTNKMAMLLGVNSWKDLKTVPHKFEEIFLFNVSMTQQINLNPLDKKGLVAGVGLMENAHFIFYHPVKFNIGLSFNLAYKF